MLVYEGQDYAFNAFLFFRSLNAQIRVQSVKIVTSAIKFSDTFSLLFLREIERAQSTATFTQNPVACHVLCNVYT